MGFETDIERMYRAGKTDIPNAADRLSGISSTFYDALQTLDQQAALAGDPRFLRTMLRVGGDLYDVLRGGVDSLNNCALAVVRTADDYVKVDDDARADFAAMDDGLRDKQQPDPSDVPPEITDPEAPGSTTEHPGDVTVTTPSTPDPDSLAEDAEQRETNEYNSAWGHNIEKHRGDY